MASYRLSERADEDFESIYVYGLRNFGVVQADAYADGLEAWFEQIANQPQLYLAVDHIRAGYRLSVYKSHSIYFRVDEGGVIIVRILRNQDVGAALE
ncbi:type II toxin-antitoxin system RelE/ParE family toxin [Marinobacter sp.]|uniref:type II toxin-antitoxin system RelE/ParE family toxin n=1 Tax=Marinobacter sp. TaxID=50741 RepID=UPI00199EAC82|nr:type II toxin-antitoxin system RelE/ParE family toxin [Marinobacter sp.]MBD3655353.1 type II toxin-antitoxin system RelE/ParE family toxin [Marinobacter sp.]